MIRNHRPRGDRWNCPSVFQQTPGFRHICYDECLAPQDHILLFDHDDDDFPLSERAAKRRRVEQLADDFLNGVTLDIHSARLDPDALKAAVAYSSFPRPKDFKYAIAECEIQNDSTELFEHVEDDQEIFRRLRRVKQIDEDDSGVFDDATASGEVVEVTEVQAQASCGPNRGLRSANVSAGPSNEALRVAAALRNRKLQPTMATTLVQSQLGSQFCPPPVIPETQSGSFDTSMDQTASDCGPSPTPAWTSSKWFKTGAFKPQRHVDEDCSRDELGASSMFSLSQMSCTRNCLLARGRPGLSTATSASFSTASSGTARSEVDASVVARVEASTGGLGEDVTSAESNDRSARASESIEYQGASKDHGESGGVARDDSQLRLLRQQGFRVAPRESWAALNDISEHAEEPTRILPDEAESGGGEAESAVETNQSGRAADDGQAKRRQTKSTGSAVEGQPQRLSLRRKSAPSQSQEAAEAQQAHRGRVNYIEVEVKGFSPLVLRKRGSKLSKQSFKSGPLQSAESSAKKTPRRKVSFPSSSPGKTRSAPPPHTPLVDGHLNTILPQAAGSGRRSSSVRRALREELEASGAELSRCDVEESSQPQPSRESATGEVQEVENPVVEEQPVVSETQWPGTQAMLAQAQCDLFTSPGKSGTNLYLGDDSTPQLLAGKGKPDRSARRALKQLSQETVALPSTQALLQGWQPWSSIKKPGVTRDAADTLTSPSLAKKPTPRSASATPPAILKEPAARSAPNSIRSLGPANRRRSSLRFSMSSSDSPAKLDRENGAGLYVESQLEAAVQPALPISKDDNGEHADTAIDFDICSPKKTIMGIFSSMRLTGIQQTPVAGNQAGGVVKLLSGRSNSGLKSSLSFGISSLDIPLHGETHTQEETILSRDLEDSPALMACYPQAQQVLADEDSQQLARTITEMTTDVLDTAITFSF
ncbi:hypothetical protein DOTSEDRAFT_37594 [Dothistroma septosporum NZE10]|uniref:Uncharacterized protein n=1 Tax=Dothistroma septosporum (strain NZE10 / CBS 128990) TaxID=675120 RepID=N1PE07_DOTSN|nr:hypothetical protein DOTSEDRAFT_37594 [Dothistroma septosporum NZE10]